MKNNKVWKKTISARSPKTAVRNIHGVHLTIAHDSDSVKLLGIAHVSSHPKDLSKVG
jgi:hypothetical protein